MRRSLKNVRAVTDNDLQDDVAGGLSVAAVRAARAQKSADARRKMARDSAERMAQLRAMKKNAIARTDNDLLDDVVGGQSLAAVRAARARKSAEVPIPPHRIACIACIACSACRAHVLEGLVSICANYGSTHDAPARMCAHPRRRWRRACGRRGVCWHRPSDHLLSATHYLLQGQAELLLTAYYLLSAPHYLLQAQAELQLTAYHYVLPLTTYCRRRQSSRATRPSEWLSSEP